MKVSHKMTSGASQYGVPINVPLLSYVFLFLAETPKSAVDENRINQSHINYEENL